ncbi:MAG: long-chain fatty acid transport protein [Thiomicrorhabdus sp.]|nr:MAG: long-chain fatty acid transport protein [Thiomicrorhabdus sp.]
MRKTKLAIAITSTIFASSVFATNGTNMTGVGAQSKALGGTGVAAYYGAENVIVNPAMIGKSEGTEFTFGGTIFMPTVSTSYSTNPASSTNNSSGADLSLIPSVATSSRINDNWTFGIGMFGTSGMGVDYRTNASLFNAQSQLQIMRFVPTLAFNDNNFGFGISPVIQYGNLDINFKNGGNTYGQGAASDLGYGLDLGVYFDVSKELTLAAAYQSAINMTYDKQLSTAGAAFGQTFGDELEQPAEIKVGAAYALNKMTYSLDYKQVQWGQAKGYKDYNWQDQNIIALGAKYKAKGYWVGVGYNHTDNPIEESTNSAINMFNNIFFPATVEKHYSVGGGYSLNKHTMIEGSIVMAPEVTSTVDVSGLSMGTSTTKHSQLSYTLSVRYNF